MVFSLHSCFSSIVTLLATTAWIKFAAAESDVKSIPLRTHSLAIPYLDNELQSRWFDYGGSTVIRADQYIRLTGAHPSQSGWVFSRVPLTATNWEIEVEFKISGPGHLFGDGMAIWITKERTEMGQVFGMKDKFEGLGIFLDTYKNNRPGVVFPYVMAMLGDGQTAYDKENDGKANELAGCSARGMRNAEFPTKARITYFQDKSLKLDLIHKREGEWTNCFEIQDFKLPSVTYLGFSAETGELSDNHDIIRVDTNNLYSPSGNTNTGNSKASNAKQKGNKKPKNQNKVYGNDKYSSDSSDGSWFWFFMKTMALLLLVVIAYMGFTVYRTRRRDRF